MKKLSFIFTLLAVAVFASATPLQLAKQYFPAKPSLEKKATPRFHQEVPAASFNAPAKTANANYNISAAFVEADYWGSYTGEDNDWVLYFVSSSNSLVVYADIYGAADDTHINGTYTFADQSIYEAVVVKAPGDTVDIVSGTITVAANSATNYHFTVSLSDGVNTYTFDDNLDVEAYDYLWVEYCYEYSYGCDYMYIDLADATGTNPGTNPGTDPGTNPGTNPGTTTALQYDESVADYGHTFTSVQLNTNFVEQYGVIMLAAEDATNFLQLYIQSGATVDPDIVVPAGTYPIDYTYAEGSVWASNGVDEDGYIDGSAVGLLSNGNVQNVWFFVSGTATVTNNNGKLHIVIAATNSYGKSIDAIVDAPAEIMSALEDVDAAKASKFIQNGQLLIQKDGKYYNALGVEVK